MKLRILVKGLFFFFVVLSSSINIWAQSLEEFNGPFASWSNIKINFGAKGNGISDDTRAFQRALDSIGKFRINESSYEGFSVLFIPSGIYNISSTLLLKGKIGVTIVGEDLETTKIIWTGADDDTVLLANGSAYFKVSNLTWVNNGHTGVEAIGIHWKKKEVGTFASLNIEISDNVFSNGFKYGVSGGTTVETGTGQNDSEICIKRCDFFGCTAAGINIVGFNALDYWIWDCKFLVCNIGINSRLGNFHAYRCYFEKSLTSDVMQTGGYYTSLRGCYSNGSKMFSKDDGASSNPFKRIFQGNSIVNSGGIPIEYYHLGKLTAIRNFFGSSSDTNVHAAIKMGSWAKGSFELLSLNNSYAFKEPINFLSKPSRLYSFADARSATSLRKAVPLITMNTHPSYKKRKIYEVPKGASGQIIQSIINEVVRNKASRSIIHFPPGKYFIDKPLLVPQGADLQIIGDGFLYASIILPTSKFPPGESMLKVEGPSVISIKEIQWGSFTTNLPGINGFQFNNADQTDSQIFIDQLYSNSKNSINAKKVDYLYIQKDNSFFSDGCHIAGGKLRSKGLGTSTIHCFGGQFAGARVDNGAGFVAKDCWWEGTERNPLTVSGTGNLTIDGAMVAPQKSDSGATILVEKFSGKLNLLNMYIQGGIRVKEDNSMLKMLFWNIHFYHTLNPLKFVTPAASYKGVFWGLTAQCFTKDSICADIQTLANGSKNVSDTSAYIPLMLEDDAKSAPRLYKVISKKATNIFLSRVALGDFKSALQFSR